MHYNTDDDALEMVRHMLRWTIRGQLDWDVTPETLRTNRDGVLSWHVKPALGGPVEITHRVHSLHDTDLTRLAGMTSELFRCAEEVERYSGERAHYEQKMRHAAKTLLRRKVDAGIKLVGVVSLPIPTHCYHSIGVEVTFTWDDDDANSATFEVGGPADLKEELERLIDELGRYRLAA